MGELFKNRLKDKKSKNLLVIITPYIIPQTKDLSYVRESLTKLKILEDRFLQKVLKDLKNKKEEEKLEENFSNKQNHKKMLQKYFNL